MGLFCSKQVELDEVEKMTYALNLKQCIRNYFFYKLGELEPTAVRNVYDLDEIRRALKTIRVDENEVLSYENFQKVKPHYD